MIEPLSNRSYFIGILIIFASAYSQYFIKDINSLIKMLVVYGIPVAAVSFLWGATIIKRAFHHMLAATKYGLGSYGLFTILGMVAGFVIFLILAKIDPNTSNLLHRPNPVLHISPEYAWIMIGVSFLVIGPVEEYIFRGFVYGGLLSIFKNRHWISLAFISAILFALVHLYYGFVYGVASLIPFTELVAFGMAMAVTYYLSKGNLLIPALIHGTYDATGFLGVATSTSIGLLFRIFLMIVGIIVAFTIFIQKRRKSRP